MGVVADLVTGCMDRARDFRKALDILPTHEERGPHPMFGEEFEQRRCGRARPVVECQRDLGLRTIPAIEGPPKHLRRAPTHGVNRRTHSEPGQPNSRLIVHVIMISGLVV